MHEKQRQKRHEMQYGERDNQKVISVYYKMKVPDQEEITAV
jgi:hypothetical protein